MKLLVSFMGLLVLGGCATTCYEDELAPKDYSQQRFSQESLA